MDIGEGIGRLSVDRHKAGAVYNTCSEGSTTLPRRVLPFAPTVPGRRNSKAATIQDVAARNGGLFIQRYATVLLCITC